jgi:hypothetical protein
MTQVIYVELGEATHKTYLGDGLYAEVTGGMVRLWCDRASGVHEVFLEPSVLESFLIYINRLKKEQT